MNQRSIFETTCGRCGTHWVKYILSQTLGFREELPNVHDFSKPEGRIKEYPTAILEKELESPGGYIYTYHVPLWYLSVLKDTTNILVVVRDPRDVCVSAIYYDIMKGLIPEDYFEKDLIARLDAGGVPFNFIDSYLKYSKSLKHYLLRYEYLVKQPFLEMKRLLSFFGYQYTDDKLRKAINSNTFKKLSGGRDKGEEDSQHHYRKGIVGDWKNYLSSEHNERFLKKYGQIMKVWGYL